MDDWLVALFFPSGAPTGIDLDDPQQCSEAALAAATEDLLSDGEDPAGIEVAARRAVAVQLLTGEPIEVQETVELVLSQGRSARETWAALDLAFADALEHSSDPAYVTESFRANL